MSTVGELFAPKYMQGLVPTVEEQAAMAKDLGADTLFYLPIDAISRAIGMPTSNLCRACISGEYPTPTGERLYELSLVQRDKVANGRTYEQSKINAPVA